MGTVLEDSISVLDDCGPKIVLFCREAVVAGTRLADHPGQSEHKRQLSRIAVLIGGRSHCGGVHLKSGVVVGRF